MNENARLRKRIAKLEAENLELRKKLRAFEIIYRIRSVKHWMRDGMKAEQMVADIIGGETTPVNERFDVVAASGIRFEVKYSNLSGPVRDKSTRRWTWNQIKGQDGQKIFDRLILVGKADPRYTHLYRDPDSPFVFFDIPYEKLPQVMRLKDHMIQLTTGLITSWSGDRTKTLCRFEVTLEEIAAQYGNGLSPA